MTTDNQGYLLPGLVGLYDPDFKVQCISIPKNASTYIQSESVKYNWKERHIPLHENISRFIILRDPYERYLTGVTEDILGLLRLNDLLYLSNNDKEKFIKVLNKLFVSKKKARVDMNPQFKNIMKGSFIDNRFYFGEHTITQINHFRLNEYAFLELYTYFWATNTLGEDLNVFFHEKGCKSKFSNNKQNVSTNHRETLRLLIAEFIDNNYDIKLNLLQYLQPDYNLLKLIKFYNI